MKRCAGFFGFILIVCSAPYITAQAPGPAPIRYTISLTKPSEHVVSVAIDLPPGPGERILQLPVWYALYQIRDFSQYVGNVRIGEGSTAAIRKSDKSKWNVSGVQAGATIKYEVFANNPGPFGAQLNSHHAFFNLAELLMYPSDVRDSPIEVHFNNIPKDWRIGTTLRQSSGVLTARNYDELADSPLEIGAFEENDFEEGGGHYRVIVDGSRASYDMRRLESMLRRIVAAEVAWMGERPFSTYLFIYHFPSESGAGGMEHAYSTAIDLDAHTLATNPHALESVSAHEFFHLWNVKRIRPQSLEPCDYSQEKYTDALWFSEGVTSTVEDYTLLWTGLIDEHEYLTRLASAIAELENRPAHSTQSAEESSLDAWLEKYSYYRQPQRSISYYNKGDLLGVLLDLKIREASAGAKSLRDLFQKMNPSGGKQVAVFADSEGVRKTAETIAGIDFGPFFQKYVAGTEEIPWNEMFGTVGLRLGTVEVETADLGFTVGKNFDSPLEVLSVAENSAAQNAGLSTGDLIITIDNRLPAHDIEQELSALHPGNEFRMRIRNANGEREVRWKLAAHKSLTFRFIENDQATPQQKLRREAWLKGVFEAPRHALQ